MVISSSTSGARLEPEDPVVAAKLKLDVVFGNGGRRSERKLGDVLDTILEGEEVEPGEKEEEVLMKDVPDEELKP